MKNVTDTGRFSIGEKIFGVCFVENTPQSNSGVNALCILHPSLLMRFNSIIENFRVETEILTVSEHHKVSWRYDTQDKKNYDGYILTSTSGLSFNNQFPYADYGQMSDLASWIFFAIDETNNTVRKYIDVSMVMPYLYGAKSDNNNPDQEFYAGLYDEISAKFEEAFPGKCLETSPFSVYENGKNVVIKEFFNTIIVDKAQ